MRQNIEILAADLYGAIFKSFNISPSVRGTNDGQHRAAVKFLGLIERFFISINLLCNDVVAPQLENVIHVRFSGISGRTTGSIQWTPPKELLDQIVEKLNP